MYLCRHQSVGDSIFARRGRRRAHHNAIMDYKDFKTFYKDNYLRAFHLALRILRDEEMGRDVVAGAYESIWRQMTATGDHFHTKAAITDRGMTMIQMLIRSFQKTNRASPPPRIRPIMVGIS